MPHSSIFISNVPEGWPTDPEEMEDEDERLQKTAWASKLPVEEG